MRPTWRAAGAVSLALILFLYGATSEVPWLFLLAWFLAALVVASVVYAAWNRRGLSLHLRLTGATPTADSPLDELPAHVLRAAPTTAPLFEGDGFTLEVGILNAGGPRGPAWVSGTLGGAETNAGAAVVPSGLWVEERRMAAVPRGVLGARGWKIHSSDPLGFFRDVRPVADATVALALPRFKSLADRTEARELEAATAAPRAGAGHELFGIREYRPGDSLRRIHWRSSARLGELVVREYEPPGLRTVAILVDPEPPNDATADQIARIAASEAWDCVRAGGRVVLGELVSRDIWDVLEALARYPTSATADAGIRPATVVVSADPRLLDPAATRNWLVGDAPVGADVDHARVGLTWPL
ncbi:MAG TPA: DUF58 domain-containing protein [Candidatus Dormibacteraeota bacterium]|nr:DUF58 domain-containing protein [Candidatus Dormibacteraeota bacterium]